MLGDISGATNIFIITGYTDMRKSVDGLCAIVKDQLKEEPNGNSIYLFCGKRCNRIKVQLHARPNQNMSDEELENLAPWSPKVQKCCVNKS